MATYHHGDLRPALLEAAGRIVDKEGAGALSVREAARRAGVSHNAPYRHFPDRESLLTALADDSLSELKKAMAGVAGREMAEAYLRYALEHPRRFRLIFNAGRRHVELEAQFAAGFTELGTGAALAGAAAWSLVHGLSCLLIDGHFGGDDVLARQALSAVRFVQRA